MQRTDEWLKNYNNDYFDRQFETPYRSTIAFCDWLERKQVLTPDSNINVLDVATGKGANLFYMAQRFKAANYVGVDINPEFVQQGNQIMEARKLDGQIKLETADIYNFSPRLANRFQGLMSLQTLSWLPDFEAPIKSMAALNADWIALTSLFFDGDVNCKIEIEEYTQSLENIPKKTFYNIYSIPLVERLFRNLGYESFSYEPFEIDVDLPRPDHKIMGTHTEKLQNGKRIQISGPLLMSWYFILARR